tara:strand:- start:432 stop:668 length:237 start_codon:yes stop_codon:yes gene_type:complete
MKKPQPSYSPPVSQPKTSPKAIEIIGMTLQIKVSRGSVFGLPAMYQMISARNIPGSTMEAPMMTVRNVRITLPLPRLS